MNDRTRKYPILHHFNNDDIPENLHEACQWFNTLAYRISRAPHNQETDMALRKLLEARDCFIRSSRL